MKFFQTIAALSLAATSVSAGDCYCNKVEPRDNSYCNLAEGVVMPASIANYGHCGPCLDVTGYTYLATFVNSGCSSPQSLDVHFYANQLECENDSSGANGFTYTPALTDAQCTAIPPGATWVRSVCADNPSDYDDYHYLGFKRHEFIA